MASVEDAEMGQERQAVFRYDPVSWGRAEDRIGEMLLSVDCGYSSAS
jgi:hypothetical protein